MNHHRSWRITLPALAAALFLAGCGAASPADDPQSDRTAGAGASFSQAVAAPAAASAPSPGRTVMPAVASAGPPARPAAAAEPSGFSGDRAEVERFLAFDRRIQLSPAQEAVRVEALSSLPAPCCSSFSAATCCCKCNLARATWGLAKHLIAERGYGADQVREAVAAWHRTTNPGGFSGAACFNGGCGRALRHDGCGGMVDGELVS